RHDERFLDFFVISLPSRPTKFTLLLPSPVDNGAAPMHRSFLALGLAALWPLAVRAAEPAVAADLVIVNAKIWTVNAKMPEAEALAVVRDRIVAVGKDVDIRAMIGSKTRVLDLKGQRVVPGFYDSHVHMLGSGLRLSEVALKDAKDEAEFGKRLQDFDDKTPRDRWMLGGEWDHDRAFKGTLPTAELIDKYVAKRPVFLRRYDGHMGVANTAALKLAGITAETPDPPGGVIYRKPGTKEPTGLLRDNAMDLVDKRLPPPTA